MDPKPITSTAATTPVPTPAAVAPKPVFATFDDFKKIEIRSGKILSAEKIPETDKLLKLSVDFAEAAPRQIVSGISTYFPDPAVLVGKTCMFVANLEPRTIRGFQSNGMLFAVSTADGKFSLLEPNGDIPPGTIAK
ncbi:MAG: hypothetical protein AAB391_03345 [Patescibacteria group bacterium]